MATNRRYTIMSLPQKIEGNTLTLNIVLTPRNRDPYAPLDTGLPMAADPPPFANLDPEFKACLVTGLGAFPCDQDPSPSNTWIALPAPGAGRLGVKQNVLNMLSVQFGAKIVPQAVRNDTPEPVVPESQSVSKYLPKSYRSAFTFTTPRHPNARTDDSYQCAFKDGKPKTIPPFVDNITWGKIFAHVLRQPVLAEACGMIFRAQVTVGDDFLDQGGYVFVTLSNDSCVTAQNASLLDPEPGNVFTKHYAARIPHIEKGSSRPLFSALLFPVCYGPAFNPPAGSRDVFFAEANEYDDGFAKIVHAVQPVSGNLTAEEQDGFQPVKDAGIRLAWDDEQIMIWYIRQLAEDAQDPGSGKRADFPLGVYGYHVDAHSAKPGSPWSSLNMVKPKSLASFSWDQSVVPIPDAWELPYQVFPTQLADNETYWLPMYYTNWIGHSLVLKDHVGAAIYHNDENVVIKRTLSPASKIVNTPVKKQIGLEQIFEEVYRNGVAVPLHYGESYQFRVRLADISGGGPAQEDDAQYDAPNPFTQVDFRRYLPPSQLRLTDPAHFAPTDTADHRPEYFNDLPSPTDPVFDGQPKLHLQRPLLNYPAVLFTNTYDEDIAVELLTNAAANSNTAFGIADPDVTKVEIIVEVESLRMDNLLSRGGQENFLPLYVTERKFTSIDFSADKSEFLSGDYDVPLDIDIQFVDVPVLNFGDADMPFGSGGPAKSDIDAMDGLVLPSARKVRLTLRAVCDDRPEYFGFPEEEDHDLNTRYGKTTQLLFFYPSVDETKLLEPSATVPAIQGIYLQPDPPPINDGSLLTALIERTGPDLQPDIVQRLAAAIGVECKGLTLVAKKGERIAFGCSSRIRHSLSPDHSSITFATKDELIHHWICCLCYRLNRDWSWNALEDVGFIISREREFVHSADKEEIDYLGDIEIKSTASFQALQADAFGAVDRGGTTLIFIDAVEPKELPAAGAKPPFPDELRVTYTVRPNFTEYIRHDAAHPDPTLPDPLHSDPLKPFPALLLPSTLPPTQVPKLLGAGLALTAYTPNDDYSATEPRQRFLWLQFAEPVADPHDAIFCRVLAKAPDQLLSNNHPDLFPTPEEPALPIDPELTRMITPGESDDRAGITAMQLMEQGAHPEGAFYLLPLPPGLSADSPELFGFYTYEFRIGHGNPLDKDFLWSTAQGRFGRPLRVTGIQHPAPTLLCTVGRDQNKIFVNAPFAKAVHGGKDVTARPPRTKLWCLLYAQVRRADGQAFRNILLDEKDMPWNERLFDSPDERKQYLTDLRRSLKPEFGLHSTVKGKLKFNEKEILAGAAAAMLMDQPMTGLALWDNGEVRDLLNQFGLPEDSPLSVLVIEIFGNITNLREQLTNFDERSAGWLVETAAMAGIQEHQLSSVKERLASDSPPPAESMAMNQSLRPLGDSLGSFRILRTSPLTAIPAVCCEDCRQYNTVI